MENSHKRFNCLTLVLSKENERRIYFESELQVKLWYNAVVEAQGFIFNDIRSQYVIKKKIGETKSGRNIYKA